MMCEGIEEHYQRIVLKELGGGGGLEDRLEEKLNAAMVIRICDYDGKMGEMLETGTYRKLKRNSTATPGEWLYYQLDTCSPFPLSFLQPTLLPVLPLSFHPLPR